MLLTRPKLLTSYRSSNSGTGFHISFKSFLHNTRRAFQQFTEFYITYFYVKETMVLISVLEIRTIHINCNNLLSENKIFLKAFVIYIV